MYRIIQGNCLEKLSGEYNTIFVDPPDNIGLEYDGFVDKNPNYDGFMRSLIHAGMQHAQAMWVSFNAIHMLNFHKWVEGLDADVRVCIQYITFYQHTKYDLGHAYRPILRILRDPKAVFPDAIRIPSWRMLHGDKRANPEGKVPGDVFDFPRVTGNSKQRRSWHKTQLHEGLVERCLLLTTPEGGRVADLCAGTGTTLRVAKRNGFSCDLYEISPVYCQKLSEEHGIEVTV